MKPQREDITVYQGATFVRRFVWKTGEPPVPVDLTGYTIRMQIRLHKQSSKVLANLDNDTLGGITISDALNGQFDVRIEASKTDEFLKIAQAVYDIEMESLNGTVTRLLEGQVSVSVQVTRPVN